MEYAITLNNIEVKSQTGYLQFSVNMEQGMQEDRDRDEISREGDDTLIAG
jgi:hypothetical protein